MKWTSAMQRQIDNQAPDESMDGVRCDQCDHYTFLRREHIYRVGYCSLTCEEVRDDDNMNACDGQGFECE